MTETWLPVVGYEGRYLVSSLGRIRSLITGQLLKPSKNYAGYHVVTLSPDRRQHRLHVLVLTAFLGPRPSPQHDGCHRDDNKDDNRLVSLRWDTKKGNIAERRSFRGQRNPNSKLLDYQLKEIREKRQLGMTLQSIADAYNVTSTRVSQICR